MGQDKFRRKSGGVQATQYDPRGSTAIVYLNTVQCSPKFTAILPASTNIAVPYRYLDTAAARPPPSHMVMHHMSILCTQQNYAAVAIINSNRA